MMLGYNGAPRKTWHQRKRGPGCLLGVSPYFFPAQFREQFGKKAPHGGRAHLAILGREFSVGLLQLSRPI